MSPQLPAASVDEHAPRPPRRLTRRPVPWALRLCVLIVHPVSSLLFALHCHHLSRIPPVGGVLLVANHVSILDPLACARLVWDAGRVPHFLAKDSVFRGPAGPLLRAAGQIPVSRGTSEAGSSVHAARATLGAGELVYGQSITDACMAWDDTVLALDDLAGAARSRRAD